jgi:hypothetical protein
VQKEVLAKNDNDALEVYAVWFSMISGDHRKNFDSRVLSDPRVTHLWDEGKIAGRWFQEHFDVEGCSDEILWDAFLVFGPEASWTDVPEPLVSAGAPIWSARGDFTD